MLCRDWSLVHEVGNHRRAIPLRCRSWSCQLCAPLRRKKLIAQGIKGRPQVLLTLTVNPGYLSSPEERARGLVRAWRNLRQWIRREYDVERLPFLAVMEATKAGEPHLHILARMPYVPQHRLSEKMAEYLDAPVVDIRYIRNPQQAVGYVAKYIGKAPERFGDLKRYWSSQDWLTNAWTKYDEDVATTGKWLVVMEPIPFIRERWEREGIICRTEEDGSLTGLGHFSLWL